MRRIVLLLFNIFEFLTAVYFVRQHLWCCFKSHQSGPALLWA